MIENKKRKKIIHFNIVEEKKFKNAKKLKPNKFINDVYKSMNEIRNYKDGMKTLTSRIDYLK